MKENTEDNFITAEEAREKTKPNQEQKIAEVKEKILEAIEKAIINGSHECSVSYSYFYLDNLGLINFLKNKGYHAYDPNGFIRRLMSHVPEFAENEHTNISWSI